MVTTCPPPLEVIREAANMYALANVFRNAGQQLALSAKEQGGKIVRFYPIPAVVHLGHATELYLKSALLLTGARIKADLRVHDLQQLYYWLPDEQRAVMRCRLKVDAGDMSTLLAPLAEVVRTWRYIYENEALELNERFLVAFSEAAEGMTFELLRLVPNPVDSTTAPAPSS